MNNTPIIIGIAGKKQSGKDTIASMINYIVDKGVTRANYYNWLGKRNTNDIIYKKNITHFADALKDTCSFLFNIDRDKFDDTEYKDSKYYDLQNKVFIKDAPSTTYDEITIEHLNKDTLSNCIVNIQLNYYIPIIKLRTILQYVGTNIGRNMLYKDIWIFLTKRKITDIVSTSKICLVPDVRFNNEFVCIKRLSNYKTAIVKIIRDSVNIDNHESENIDFECDYIIENDGTLMNLFYKVQNIIKQIIEKQS